jgi:NAD(P)-dependent dehydrogenase (short-subunit alcohol dehydrogenase family)
VLVNNAGYSQSGAVESIPMDAVRRQFETNVFGLVRMCQLVLRGCADSAGVGSSTSARWAAGSLAPATSGPYTDFNNAVGAAMGGAYGSGGVARFAAGPEAVGTAIEKAIRRPHSRVRVAASARIMLAPRRVMPDAVWIARCKAAFRNPGPSTGIGGLCVH